MGTVMYLLSCLSLLVLLWPYPFTVFLAGSFAVLTYPIYNTLHEKLPKRNALIAYISLLVAIIIIPLSALVLLVAPQAKAGLNTFNKMRANNFQIPESWQENFLEIKSHFINMPGFKNIFNELTQSFDALLSQTIGTIVSGGFGFVGTTLNAMWVLFLFVILTALFCIYAKHLKKITLVITKLPLDMLDRFIKSIRGALNGVVVGIVSIAICQGILCGIGFAVAGINQPAFWGLLATMVAPIPIIGTAIVWVPLCFFLWFTGSTFAAVGLAIWGIVAVAGIDNILRPLLLQRGINAPFFVLILSILCGIVTFGPAGLVMGPILVAFAIQAAKEGEQLIIDGKNNN